MSRASLAARQAGKCGVIRRCTDPRFKPEDDEGSSGDDDGRHSAESAGQSVPYHPDDRSPHPITS